MVTEKINTRAQHQIAAHREMKVKVIEVDNERSRISLSCKTEEKKQSIPRKRSFERRQKKVSFDRKNTDKKPARRGSVQLKNKAFSALKDFKTERSPDLTCGADFIIFLKKITLIPQLTGIGFILQQDVTF